jgi:hypothetical protein
MYFTIQNNQQHNATLFFLVAVLCWVITILGIRARLHKATEKKTCTEKNRWNDKTVSGYQPYVFFRRASWGGVTLSPLGTSAYLSAPDDISGMIIGRGNAQRKSCPSATYAAWIPQGTPWAQTPVSVARNRQKNHQIYGRVCTYEIHLVTFFRVKILSRFRDVRLQTGFELLTRFIDNLYIRLGNTSPYNVVAELHTTNH